MENFTVPDGTTSNWDATEWTTTYNGPGNADEGRFTTAANEFRVNNITVNAVGTWRSGVINISGKNNVSISVDIRSGVLPGGALDNDNSTHYDYLRLYYKINGGAEVLYSEHRGAINGNSTINTTVVIDSLVGSTLQVIVRARATATDEIYYFDNVKVTGEPTTIINASATVSGSLDCAHDSVILSGNSTTVGVTYFWSGPNGFSANCQNVTVTEPGTYTLTVFDTALNPGTVTVVVIQDVIVPSGVTASYFNALNCLNPGTTITGTSVSNNSKFQWSGPDNFTASTKVISVQKGGLYTLTVTDTVNSCMTTASVTVPEDKVAPAGVTAVNDGPLTCTVTSATITGTVPAGMDFYWQGPNDFFGFSESETITDPGEYMFVVTNFSNGCVSTAVTNVEKVCTNATAQGAVSVQLEQERRANPAVQFEYKTYPNPSVGKSFIEFRNSESATVMISLYNSAGIREKVLFSQTVGASQLYKIAVDASRLPGGMHYAVIRVNDKTYSRPWMLVK